MKFIQPVLSFSSILFLLIFITSITGRAQNATASNYYRNFDNAISIENTGLYQGVSYIEQFRVSSEKYQFFKSRQFLKGSLSYFGQDYYDLEIKYDVYEDEVLLKVISSAGGGTLLLFTEGLNKFTIDGHNFIKIDAKENATIETGFYESTLVSKYFNFFIKHTKRKFEKKDKSSIYFDFVSGKNKYVLRDSDGYYKIASKKDVIKKFPNLKKEIDSYYNLARRTSRSDPDAFHISLFKKIEALLSQKDNN